MAANDNAAWLSRQRLDRSIEATLASLAGRYGERVTLDRCRTDQRPARRHLARIAANDAGLAPVRRAGMTLDIPGRWHRAAGSGR